MKRAAGRSMVMIPAVLTVALVGGCNGSVADGPAAPTPEKEQPAAHEKQPTVNKKQPTGHKKQPAGRNKRPLTPPTLVADHALQPSGPLLTWLAKRPRRVVRLPVIFTRSAGSLGFDRAHLAAADSSLPTDAVSLDTDDGRLGISLQSRLRSHCGRADACLVWLDGYWRRSSVSLEPPSTGKPPTRWPFIIRAVGDRVSDADRAAGLRARSE